MSVLCRRLKKEGVRRVFVFAPHGIFASNSIELIDLSPVEKVIVTDSIPLPSKKFSSKIAQVSIAPLLAKIIFSESVMKEEISETDIGYRTATEKPALSIENDQEVFEVE